MEFRSYGLYEKGARSAQRTAGACYEDTNDDEEFNLAKLLRSPNRYSPGVKKVVAIASPTPLQCSCR